MGAPTSRENGSLLKIDEIVYDIKKLMKVS